jgi:uncharacterized lipoprotein YddW (UPF0748 family)
MTQRQDFCPFDESVNEPRRTLPSIPRLNRRSVLAGTVLGALGLVRSVRPVPAKAPAEGRALWVNRFEYDSAADIARIMAQAGEAHFNIVYFQVRGAADALYRSKLEPCAVSLCGHLGGTPPYDPLEVAVTEAEKHGLEIHAWLNALSAWPSGSADACKLLTESPPGQPQHLLLEHPDWVVVSKSGQPMACPNDQEYVSFSPAYPGVRAELARVAADLSTRYGIRGIHLDRIRYPGKDWSYDELSLASFGRDPDADPDAWDRFRRDQVNKTVRETREAMQAVDPSLTLSAAVWPVYQDRWGWHASEGFSWFYQDPRGWAGDGYLDVTVPMTYDPITTRRCDRVDWACLLDDHIDGVQRATGRHLYIGIAARNGADEALREIALGRERGVAGFSLYSYSSISSADLWSRLAKGPFKDRADIPRQPWKPSSPNAGDGSGGPATPTVSATPVTR